MEAWVIDRMKELGRFIDDMEGVRADLDSDNPDLQVHGLERLASLALDAAEKFRALPGGLRAVDFLRSCARDLMAERQQILDAMAARSERLRRACESFNESMERIKREDDATRERLRIEAETGPQPDLFNVWTEDGREEPVRVARKATGEE